MERETRIELATNSLEDCGSIENKEQLRPWRCILTIQNPEISRLLFPALLNEVNAVTRNVCEIPSFFRLLNVEGCLDSRSTTLRGLGIPDGSTTT
jgi:hypothetical protein